MCGIPSHPQAAVSEARGADKALKGLRWDAEVAARTAAQKLEAAEADAAELRRRLDALAEQVRRGRDFAAAAPEKLLVCGQSALHAVALLLVHNIASRATTR